MFNLGLPEIVIIGAVTLLVFGPKRLPELAKGLGKGIRDFKKALEGGTEEEVKLPPARNPETSVPIQKPQAAQKEAQKDRAPDSHSEPTPV